MISNFIFLPSLHWETYISQAKGVWEVDVRKAPCAEYIMKCYRMCSFLNSVLY